MEIVSGNVLGEQAERRQVTVLFSDLVGSTQLATHLDPEDLNSLLRAYQRVSAEVIERFGGHTAQYLGDGILAYFGYPEAHENDAERAVHAGLGIVQKASRLEIESGDTLAVRVGIATGLVVAGDHDANGGASASSVVGETPNLAARLQGLATPNSVMISPSTRQLIGSMFKYEDLGEHELKGFAEPIKAYRVIQERSVSSRFEAAQDTPLTPLVGRREEVSLLLGRWGQAKQGDGQVVLLVGEAGIGKSRVVQTLRLDLAEEQHTLLRYQCSPHYTNSALHPVIAQIERMADIRGSDSAADKLDKLITLLGQTFENIDPLVSLFAALLSIPDGGRYPPPPADSRQQKDKTLAALVQHLDGIATRQPTLIVVEDAHWIDPTSLEWLKLVIDWVPRARVLLILTSRPEFSPPWATRSQLTLLTLNRLSRRQSLTMVRGLPGAETLLDEIVEQIFSKTNGIPLFIEELTKVVVDAYAANGLATQDSMKTMPPRLTIPVTLQDSLTARLDQLGKAKEVAQICSVLGREFSYELLAAVMPQPDKVLAATMDKLVESGLVISRGTPPRASYVFKHALLQDAAYESLLRRKRQELHGRIADILVERFAMTAKTKPELVAHHFSAAHRLEEAVLYWEKAGRRAVARSANVEAVRHFDMALEALGAMANTPERKEMELGLRIVLGPALINTRGPLSSNVQENYSRAQRLCMQLPETETHFAAFWGLWRITRNFDEKQRIADDLLRVAGRLDDQGLLLQAHHTQWATQFHLGRHVECLRHVDEGLSIYAQNDYRSHATIYGGHDPKVCGCGEAAFSLWLLGKPEASLTRADEALAWARNLEQAGTTAHVLDMSLQLHQYRRDLRKVMERSDEIIEFAKQENFPIHMAKGHVFRGWAVAHLDDPTTGLALIRAGLDSQQNVGTREDFPIFFDMFAEVLGMTGETSEALRVIDEALSEVAASGLRYWTAELHRRKGELLLNGNMKEKAEESLLRARRTAHQQGATALELRAAMSLARFWSDCGRGAEARDLLASVHGRITEGFETADLKEATSLLREIA
jgi:class 3 adenylate cyclase/predicted ATPase/type II secretory pathway predicted ATPase ExeA